MAEPEGEYLDRLKQCEESIKQLDAKIAGIAEKLAAMLPRLDAICRKWGVK